MHRGACPVAAAWEARQPVDHPTDELALVRVCDDGIGGAAVTPGSGLAGIADRVLAVGGPFSLHNPDHGSTIVEASLPCAS
jgi:signal transduction histidine kinase